MPNLPLFTKKPSAPKKTSAGAVGGWQQSGPALEREGDRSHGALTSIANAMGSSRGKPSVSSGGRSGGATSSIASTRGSSATSSIARSTGRGQGALTTAGRHGEKRRSFSHTQTEQEADDKRYAHARRVRAKKIEQEKKAKKKGFFF